MYVTLSMGGIAGDYSNLGTHERFLTHQRTRRRSESAYIRQVNFFTAFM